MAKKGTNNTVLLRELSEEDKLIISELQMFFKEKTASKTILKTLHSYYSSCVSETGNLKKLEKLQKENEFLKSSIADFMRALKVLKKI